MLNVFIDNQEADNTQRVFEGLKEKDVEKAKEFLN